MLEAVSVITYRLIDQALPKRMEAHNRAYENQQRLQGLLLVLYSIIKVTEIRGLALSAWILA